MSGVQRLKVDAGGSHRTTEQIVVTASWPGVAKFDPRTDSYRILLPPNRAD